MVLFGKALIHRRIHTCLSVIKFHSDCYWVINNVERNHRTGVYHYMSHGILYTVVRADFYFVFFYRYVRVL